MNGFILDDLNSHIKLNPDFKLINCMFYSQILIKFNEM
jgi:hypothetical protein